MGLSTEIHESGIVFPVNYVDRKYGIGNAMWLTSIFFGKNIDR